MLLATFWSELTQSRDRTALRSALHLLRRHFPENAIRTRGDDEVGVDPELVSTDVAELLDDVAAQEFDRALGRYPR